MLRFSVINNYLCSGERLMHKAFVLVLSLMTIPLATVMAKDNKTFTLVIDAGHGGKDAGAVGKKSKEKDINLKTALAFGAYVERNCKDVRVVYTRKTDVFVELDERANIANREKADLFISIHTNALPKGRIARGFETYTLGMHRAADNLEVAKRENSVILVESNYEQRYQGFDPNSSESYIIFELMQDRYMEQSVELARMVQQEVCSAASRPDKGVHQAGFLVLRATSMPGCLIELGFITTADEEDLLNTDKGIDSHARGIYNAFIKYRKKYDKNGTVSYKPESGKTGNTATSVKPKEETSRTATAADKPAGDAEIKDRPVFKVQILAVSGELKADDARLKGESGAEFYTENGLYKYTVGASTDYNEIYRLRKTLSDKFPEAFIIAFKNGEKMNVQEAVKEFKNNKQTNK